MEKSWTDEEQSGQTFGSSKSKNAKRDDEHQLEGLQDVLSWRRGQGQQVGGVGYLADQSNHGGYAGRVQAPEKASFQGREVAQLYLLPLESACRQAHHSLQPREQI